MVDLDGSGSADLGELAADEARVSVGGSGDADVRVDKKLDVSVDGSGDVRYHGDPELTKKPRRLGGPHARQLVSRHGLRSLRCRL